ncbi:MAG: hypothetical protein ACHP7P_16590 [Terriglobales bacterium]
MAAILLLLFAAAHLFGFRQLDPQWGITSLIDSLKTTRFQVQGATRTYWDFFSGFGFFVTVLLLFSSVLSWQLATLPAPMLASLRIIRWSLAACYVIIAVLTWRYIFVAPLVFAGLVASCLTLAAWRAGAA